MIVLSRRKVDAQLHVIAAERTIAQAYAAGRQQLALVDDRAGRWRYAAQPDKGGRAPTAADMLAPFGLRRPTGLIAIATGDIAAQIVVRAEQAQIIIRGVAPGGTCLLYTSPSPRDS